MQKINRLYWTLEEEFDRREGLETPIEEEVDDDDDFGDEGNRQKTSKTKDDDPNEPGLSKREQQRRNKCQKRQRYRAWKQE